MDVQTGEAVLGSEDGDRDGDNDDGGDGDGDRGSVEGESKGEGMGTAQSRAGSLLSQKLMSFVPAEMKVALSGTRIEEFVAHVGELMRTWSESVNAHSQGHAPEKPQPPAGTY